MKSVGMQMKKLLLGSLIVIVVGCNNSQMGHRQPPVPPVGSPTQQIIQKPVPQVYQISGPFPVLKEHLGIVMTIAFSPDNRRMASGDDHRTLIIWDTASWKVLQKINNIGGSMWWPSLTFSPDGHYLLVGNAVWDTDKGALVHTLPGIPDDTRNKAAFSPDGDTLVTCGSYLIFWDTKTWKSIVRLTGGTTYMFGGVARPLEAVNVLFSPDGKTVASDWEQNHGIKFADIRTHNRKLALDDAHSPMAFSPDGSEFVAQTDIRGGTFKTWDAVTGAEKNKIETTINACQFTPDGSLLTWNGASYTKIDPKTGMTLSSFAGGGGVGCLSSDSRVYAYGSQYDIRFSQLP